MKNCLLIPGSCNYNLSFPEAVKRGVTFTSLYSDDYPLLNHEAAPEALSLYGHFKRKPLLLLSSKGMCNRSFSDASLFALEASYAGFDVVLKEEFMRCTLNTLEKHNRRVIRLLSCGVLEWLNSSRTNCCCNGAVISPFLPYTIKNKECNKIVDEVCTFFPRIVFFGFSKYEEAIALSALENGAEVYLHRAALAYPLGRRFAEEGAPIVDHVENKKNVVIYRKDDDSFALLQL